MQAVTLLCVGKLKERFYLDAAAEYEKRLSRFCKLQLIELPEERVSDHPSPAEIERALAREAGAIRARLPTALFLIALCIEGQLYSSEELSDLLAKQASHGIGPVTFVIGSSYGLHPSIKACASVKLSMSPMTFPHHLARIMLLEQVYRAYQIQVGTQYHK